MRRWMLYSLISATLVVAGGGCLYLFRQEIEDDPYLGMITHKYRWGMPRELFLDTNRDGKTDSRCRVAGDFGSFSTQDDSLLECWESRQCDGRFDLHYVWNQNGELQRLERDVDRDGEYDTVLFQPEAIEFLKQLKRQPGCKAGDKDRHASQTDSREDQLP